MATKKYIKLWGKVVLYSFYMGIIKINKTIYARNVSRACESCQTRLPDIIDQDMDRHSIENITRHSEVSEKAIERYLVEQARLNGMLCLKYSNPNVSGYPDRLLVLRGGGTVWVELKSRGRKPTKLQQVRMAELAAKGHRVEVIDCKAGIDELINSVRS